MDFNKKMKKKIIALLPARFSSTRIKKKLIKKLRGIPIILHTISRVKMIKNVDEIVVCTDSIEIKKIVEHQGVKVNMTSKHHKNGTDRIAEVARKLKADLFIDIHSDEAILDPKNVEKLINFHLINYHFDIVVPNKISNKSGGENVVKVIPNPSDNSIIYFTRSDAPYAFRKNKKTFFHHLDTISFKPNALKMFSKLDQGILEKMEGIELLRAIEHRFKLGTFSIKTSSFSINTIKDFKKAKNYLKKDQYFKKYND